MKQEKSTTKNYYVYFGPSQYTSDGINLYNRFSMILDDSLENAKSRLKSYFPGIKAYLSEDASMHSKFGMKFIDLNYQMKLTQTA